MVKTNLERKGDGERRPPKPKGERNCLKQAVEYWYHEMKISLLSTSHQITLEALLAQTPSTYTIYEPMLLLPAHGLQHEIWQSCFRACHGSDMKLWEVIVQASKVTHLAINSPIPTPHFSDQVADIVAAELRNESGEESNVIRRPSNLVPLLGDFGPLSSNFTPTEADFHSALWVTARQNGIAQTWAPVHTMFSRGNIKEKARLLALPSLQDQREPSTALDLYAGIGYFAFSYAKTGVAKVLCFEISAWSVEGLRRGAEMNGWGSVTFRPEDLVDLRADDPRLTDPKVKFLIFQMDNVHAVEVVNKIRHVLPAIRHVNCGLLPSSVLSWSTAVRCLDRTLGGFIHVHENLRMAILEEESERIRAAIHALASNEPGSSEDCTDFGRDIEVTLDHVEKVKSYSPGVMHVVLDITIRR